MSAEKTELAIPDFYSPDGDALLEDSIIGEPEPSSQEICHQIFTQGEDLTPTTYEAYMAEGTAAYEQAITNEARYGLHTAVHKYAEAQVKFLGAIGRRPLTESGKDTVEPDPIHLMLPYARCLTKQLQAKSVGPYKQPESLSEDRRANWKRFATNTYASSWEAIMADDSISDEDRLTAAIAVVGGLHILFEVPQAESLLDEASELLTDAHEIDPKLARFLDKPFDEQLHIAAELEEQASVDIVTGTHKAVARLAA